MPEFYVPGVGFRSDPGLRMPARTVVEQGARALAVIDLTSTERGTELRFEVKDEERERACLDGTLDHGEVARMDLKMRDESGTELARIEFPNGSGFGQHEFGFFSRHVGFAPIPHDARRVVLDVHGVLGDWELPIEVAPVTMTDVAAKHALDATDTVAGITLRLTGFAMTRSETVIEFELGAAERLPRGCGADMQRTGSDLLVLTDQQGRRFVEEPSRETVMRMDRRETRMYAKFPVLPADAVALMLTAGAVVVDDEAAAADVPLPVDMPTDVSFGRYRVRLGPTTLTNDLLAPPGHPAEYGLRFTMRGLDDRERVIRARRIVIGGKKMFPGFGWNPDPAVTSMSVTLPSGERPTSMELREAVVRVEGPWQVRFAQPA